VGRARRYFVYLSHHAGGGTQKEASLILNVGGNSIDHLKFLIHTSLSGG
jgi:hypothetical protein